MPGSCVDDVSGKRKRCKGWGNSVQLSMTNGSAEHENSVWSDDVIAGRRTVLFYLQAIECRQGGEATSMQSNPVGSGGEAWQQLARSSSTGAWHSGTHSTFVPWRGAHSVMATDGKIIPRYESWRS